MGKTLNSKAMDEKDETILSMAQEGLAEIKDDKVPLAKFVQIAIDLERNVAMLMALKLSIQSGDVYQLKTNGVKEEEQYALMTYILTSFKKAGEKIMSIAADADRGSDEAGGRDGHSYRFAELLDEMHKTQSRTDVGLCSIQNRAGIMPPPKTLPEEYAKFKKWCVENHLVIKTISTKEGKEICVESFNWSEMQAVADQLALEGNLPDWLISKPRREVRLR